MARVIAQQRHGDHRTVRPSSVAGADEVLVFDRHQRCSTSPTRRKIERTKRRPRQARPPTTRALLARHAKIHGELFNRMRLDLGGGADHRRTTEELLAESTYEKPNRALIEKEFDAARYNIISCTGKLPPNLQGVWGGTYVPGWASDYTHNGNVPSAIAANLMGNMPELMLAYTTYIESIVPWLEINAKHLFGARGIVLPSRSSTPRIQQRPRAELRRRLLGGRRRLGGAFLLRLLSLHRRPQVPRRTRPAVHGEGRAVLRGLPLRRARRKVGLLAQRNRRRTRRATPSRQGTYNATMDVAVAKELLRNTIAASRELGRNQDKIARWQQMLDKMPDYMVDERGIIKEWLTPRLANNDSHRHSSQLYPLYDGHARRNRAQSRASRRVPEEHRVQARQPLDNGTTRADSCPSASCSLDRPPPAWATKSSPIVA
ncbi:MAG: hypothetical protein M0C28_40065 [Candidatus Moduliflexus flocculans]|nr:hypothetical protein [Candidatus Moduliflexus flocculans]